MAIGKKAQIEIQMERTAGGQVTIGLSIERKIQWQLDCRRNLLKTIFCVLTLTIAVSTSDVPGLKVYGNG